MVIPRGSDRYRAARALQRLIGGDAVDAPLPNIPPALMMPEAGLIVVAGDGDHLLDPFALEPLSRQTGLDVLATWTDPMLAGHSFELDAVLTRDGRIERFESYRLWMMVGRRRSLVPADGVGPAIAIGEDGLKLAAQPPWLGTLDHKLGITRGRAWLHQQIYADTPYAVPLDRNLSR